MVHVAALPGTPNSRFNVAQIIKQVQQEVSIYLENGIDAIMLENMHDVPYLKSNVGPEITASMTAVSIAVRNMTDKPLGIQILAGANNAALAVAQAAQLDFIRAEGFVFGHLADEGYIESCAGDLLRYRRAIGADNIAVYTDIKKKHSSHALTTDISLAETVKTAEYFLSDGVIITGSTTGEAAIAEDVKTAREHTSLPVLIGSGITADNIESYWNFADAFIVGSSMKEAGDWKKPVDASRVTKLMNQIQMIRS